MQVSPAALIGIWSNELREVDVQCRMLDPQGEGIIEQFNLQTLLGCRLWVCFGRSQCPQLQQLTKGQTVSTSSETHPTAAHTRV